MGRRYSFVVVILGPKPGVNRAQGVLCVCPPACVLRAIPSRWTPGFFVRPRRCAWSMESGAPADRQCWNRPSNAARSASGVLQQRLEPVVHMVLDMAMKQRLPRLVGGKVHAHSAI